jgi:hypothetical protein
VYRLARQHTVAPDAALQLVEAELRLAVALQLAVAELRLAAALQLVAAELRLVVA